MIFTVATSKHKKTSNGILKKKDFKRGSVEKGSSGQAGAYLQGGPGGPWPTLKFEKTKFYP
jgi:hypothetical protein